MPEQKTIGQLMEEMRLKAGAREYSGHSYMDLNRFAEDTRHMIIFDTLTADSPVGWKGERSRAFLTEEGYKKSLERQEQGHIRIVSHAKVRNGNLRYDRQDCQRQFEIVRKRRRNFVVFRRGGNKTKRFLVQKECSRFAVSGA